MVGKKELVERIAEVGGFTKKDVNLFLNVLSEQTAVALENGETVKIGSIVTLEPVFVEAAAKRNPKTQESVDVEAHNKVMTQVSDTIKNRVWTVK